MKYLLPCGQCGDRQAIDSNQAGQRVTCRCGAAVEVPSLRDIRRLERAETAPVGSEGRNWNPVRGTVFAAGLLGLIAGVGIAGYGWLVWRHLDTAPPPAEDLTAAYAMIEKLTPIESLSLWQDARAQGLGRYQLPPYVWARGVARTCAIIMLSGACLAVVGCAAAVGSGLFRCRTRRRAG